MKTPEPYSTEQGVAVDLGVLYRYDKKDGAVTYILSAFREEGSPRGFFISRKQVHEQIDKLLDILDEHPASSKVAGSASKKWAGEADD
jgi:hypothetical protein